MIQRIGEKIIKPMILKKEYLKFKAEYESNKIKEILRPSPKRAITTKTVQNSSSREFNTASNLQFK
jgi:hypothetical protein